MPDVAAYYYLQPLVDIEALMEIERAQVPASYFKSFVTAFQAALAVALTAKPLPDVTDPAAANVSAK